MISDAVGLERISRVLGYKLGKGDFRTTSPNLPQSIAVFCEANTANQDDLDLTPKTITSAKQAGELYGYGSPAHIMARIFFPRSGDLLGGIPLAIYPQAEAAGAAAKVLEITPTGVANANGTHTIFICGRGSLDGVSYDINILEGDTESDITAKISDAINAVLGSPVSADSDDYVATLTSKWKGLTANDINVYIDTNDGDLGITYVIDETQAASGTPSVQSQLDAIGSQWITQITNGYGAVDSVMNAFEAWNGKPTDNPTGRYGAIIFKPSVVYTGSILADPSSITDDREEEVTIVIAPAPLSKGLPMEAAANMTLMAAICAQNTPEGDIAGKPYFDMPTPTLPSGIGAMAIYENRDAIVKKGCSTVDWVSGVYQVQDCVTTYHPDGENPPQFRFVRNLVIDMNVRYSYFLREQASVVDHVIASDDDMVLIGKVVKPKMWKQECYALADDLVQRALLTDAAFMKSKIAVGIGTNNPDRFETSFEYKRSGFGRVLSTNGKAGFNFGTLNA